MVETRRGKGDKENERMLRFSFKKRKETPPENRWKRGKWRKIAS